MWFIADRVAREMRARMAAGFAVSAEAQAAFIAEDVAARDSKPRNYNVVSDTAEIRVEGLLTKKPDFFAWLMGYGNTTYADIQQSLALAETDPTIKKIQFVVDSPGGQVDGLFDTIAAITDAKKPRSVVTSFAASAAYAIASVAGKITATNAAVEIGSVGVALDLMVFPEDLSIANTESPNKRPDLTTDEGKAIVRQELDALFEIMVESIAWGRETTVKDVTENFGRGGVFVAGEAKRRGMIDRVARPMLRAAWKRTEASAESDNDGVARIGDVIAIHDELVAQGMTARQKDAPAAGPAAGETAVTTVVAPEPPAKPAAGGGEHKETHMDLKTLEKDHPELVAAIRKDAVDAERDRVNAHLEMGEGSGDMQTAVAAIKDGSPMTQTLVAKYAKASMRKNSVEARQQASDQASTATGGAEQAEPQAKSLMDTVAENLERGAGLKK